MTFLLLSRMYLSSMVIFVLGYSLYDGYLRLRKSKLDMTVCSISAISSTIDLLSLRSDKFAVRKASIDVIRLVWVVIIIAAHASFNGIEPRLIVKVGMLIASRTRGTLKTGLKLNTSSFSSPARLDTDFKSFFEPFYMQPFFNAAVIEGFFYIGCVN